jgi:hypothetical protein
MIVRGMETRIAENIDGRGMKWGLVFIPLPNILIFWSGFPLAKAAPRALN